MADFCDVEDVEEFLLFEITDADDIASVERAIGEAAAAIRNYCHQVIDLVTNETITRDVDPRRVRFFLPELPVQSVTEVVENDELLVEGDDYKLGDHGILYRVGAYWFVGIQTLEVTYTHGLDTPLPEDLVGVCARAASRAYQAGLKAEDSEGVPGVASKSLGDYAVAYTGQSSNEGTMGASGARMLLRSEEDMLNRYRYVAQ